MLKHAKEDMFSNPEEWAASMQNLLDIFEMKMNVKPTINLKLKRLLLHHIRHKKKPIPPKSAIPYIKEFKLN